jgi:hypothetical protein
VTLPEGFADQVLDAAIASAKSEGLGDDHPLVRLAEQPSLQPTSSSPAGVWRTAGVLVALAASIVIAVFALRPDPLPQGPNVVLNPESQELGPGDERQADPVNDSQSSTAVAAAQPAVDPQDINAVAQQPATADAADHAAAIAAADPAGGDSLAAESTKAGTTASPAPAMVATNVPGKLGGIIVVDIRLTAKGRESQALKNAMRAAGITAESEKRITDEIVGLAQEAADDIDSGDAKVIYLQAFGKGLDNFYLELFQDREGVESIGLALAQDAPLLGMVDSFHKLDATLVRHEVNWKLASDNGAVKALAADLGKRTYVPMSRDDAQGAAAALSAANGNTQGQDFPSQLILLVR